jgi:hypothetical protein
LVRVESALDAPIGERRRNRRCSRVGHNSDMRAARPLALRRRCRGFTAGTGLAHPATMYKFGWSLAVVVVVALAGCTSSPPPPPCTIAASPSSDGSFAASGTFTGAHLDGRICTNGASAELEQLSGQAAMTIFADGGCVMKSPSGANDCQLGVSLYLASTAPGTYRSAGGNACDNIILSVTYPTPSVDCKGAVYPTPCPTGCSYGSGNLQIPPACMPTPVPTTDYYAEAGGNCMDTSYPEVGSWTLELSSVVPAAGANASGRFVAHGSLEADVVSGVDFNSGLASGSRATATLSMSF